MTIQHKPILVLGIVAVIAVTTALLIRLGQGAATPEAVGAQGEIVEQLRRIEQRLDRLESNAFVSEHASRGTPMTARQDALPREAERARKIDTARRQRAGLDATFASAPRGGARQASAAKELDAKLSNPALSVEAEAPLRRDIQCRGDLCRMEFVFDHVSKADDWGMFYPALTGRQLARIDQYSDRNPDGTTTLVMYGHLR